MIDGQDSLRTAPRHVLHCVGYCNAHRNICAIGCCLFYERFHDRGALVQFQPTLTSPPNRNLLNINIPTHDSPLQQMFTLRSSKTSHPTTSHAYTILIKKNPLPIYFPLANSAIINLPKHLQHPSNPIPTQDLSTNRKQTRPHLKRPASP